MKPSIQKGCEGQKKITQQLTVFAFRNIKSSVGLRRGVFCQASMKTTKLLTGLKNQQKPRSLGALGHGMRPT
jgi:hypothetical protein